MYDGREVEGLGRLHTDIQFPAMQWTKHMRFYTTGICLPVFCITHLMPLRNSTHLKQKY